MGWIAEHGRVYRADREHWVFASTGLGRDDTFGDDTSPPLVDAITRNVTDQLLRE